LEHDVQVLNEQLIQEELTTNKPKKCLVDKPRNNFLAILLFSHDFVLKCYEISHQLKREMTK
jgi:hypothetical protein